tara:strand:- start:79 stop:324 length:246 start_codon:yes stop_codon:yes gene_type:complete
MLESEEEYFISKVGDDMDNDFVSDYLGAAAFTYDRSAYAIFRPPFEETLANFTDFVAASLDKYFGDKQPSAPKAEEVLEFL